MRIYAIPRKEDRMETVQRPAMIDPEQIQKPAVMLNDFFPAQERLPDECVDMVFWDPPYFLSREGGRTCQSGKAVAVNKAEWDEPPATMEDLYNWNANILVIMKRIMKPTATIWVTGTQHNILHLGSAMQFLGFHILNPIWPTHAQPKYGKRNPPPNLGCRRFTDSFELMLWACREEKGGFTFNYQAMKERFGDGKQVKNVWDLVPPSQWEKRYNGTDGRDKQDAKYRTQKPESLLERVILSSTNPGDLVLDPMMGTGSVGVVAVQNGRRFLGIDKDPDMVDVAELRLADAVAGVTKDGGE